MRLLGVAGLHVRLSSGDGSPPLATSHAVCTPHIRLPEASRIYALSLSGSVGEFHDLLGHRAQFRLCPGRAHLAVEHPAQ